MPGVNSMSSLLEKDAGFCSGSSEHEDDHHSHDDLHSPTDTSEDSVEVKFTPILKNKRKSSEPSRVIPDPEQGPLKKRFRYEQHQQQQQQQLLLQQQQQQQNNVESPNLHRPWALAAAADPADILLRHPAVTTLHRAICSEQEEPLALIAKKPATSSANQSSSNSSRPSSKTQNHYHEPLYESSIESLIKKTQISRIQQSQPKTLDTSTANRLNSSSASTSSTTPSTSSQSSHTTLLPQALPAMTSAMAAADKPKSSQRNYKNMTRERRIEANARERTRVHTISAAYDTLRHAIPSYSSTQKLSKLSVLRVACSYILTLSRLAGDDFSIDQSEPPIQDCIDAVTRTIQTEGKLRRKKDE